MITRKRRRTTTALSSSLAIVLLAAIAMEPFASAGITGTSIRRNSSSSLNNNNNNSNSNSNSNNHIGRWSKSEHYEQQQQQQQSRNLQNLSGLTSAMESCEAAKQKEETDIAPSSTDGTSSNSRCECEQVILDERYNEFLDPADQPIVVQLTCVDERCSYCSPDGSTCDRFSYGAIFEEIQIREGISIKDAVAQIGYFETNQYIVGRPEAVVYTEYNDPSVEGGQHSCSMEIDGLMCAVCEYVDCIDSGSGSDSDSDSSSSNNEIDLYYGLNVVCSNILIGDGEGGYNAASDFETCNQDQLEMIGASQGVFEMYDPDYGQCYTAVEGCDRDKIELEQSINNNNGEQYYDCECKDEGLPTDGMSPFLENVKLKCDKKSGSGSGSNNVNDSCNDLQQDTILRTYSSYVIETNTRSIIHNDDKTVTIEEFDCETTKGAADGCKKCRASIDDQECESCTMDVCSDGDVSAAKIKCGNVDSSITNEIDLCLSENNAKGTPFEHFGICGFGASSEIPIVVTPESSPPPEDDNNNAPVNNANEDLPPPPPPASLMACREKQLELLESGNYIDSELMVCDCIVIDENSDDDSGTLLSCTTDGGDCGTLNGGSVCNVAYNNNNDDGGACFREELVQGFLPANNKTPLTRTTTYTHGTALGNSMIGRTLVLTEYENGKGGCELLMDGTTCNSCELQTCSQEAVGIRPIVDCSNVIDEQSFRLDSCETFPSYDEGLLLRFAAGAGNENNNDDNNFSVCSKEFAQDESNNNDNDNGGGDNGGDSGSNVDISSLSTTCQKAQPIVLPTQQDDVLTIAREQESTSNASFISFISSTNGITSSSGNSVEPCTGEGTKSPGLWYSLVGDGQGIHASVCREATDFEARISVYKGESGCDNLSCVAGTTYPSSSSSDGNNDLCDVHWVAEKGTTYYIRVHGSSSSQSGTFNFVLEPIPDDVTGTCTTIGTTSEFDPACLSCANEMATMKSQSQSQTPNDMDCQCIANTGTGGYHLTCVDVSCLKCNGKQDICGFDTYELDIQSQGEIPIESYESFYFLSNAPETQASEINALKNTGCLEINDPYQQCMVAQEEMMSSEDSKVFCECRGTSEEGDYMLLCSIDDSYDYCASSSSGGSSDDVCASVLFGQTISQYGSITSEFRNFDFKAAGGEDESIIVERSDNGCSVTMNGKACSKCELMQCENKINEDTLDLAAAVGSGLNLFTDMSVDCSNVIEGRSATFECGSVGGGGGGEGDNDDNGDNLLSILVGDVLPSTENNNNNNNEVVPTSQTIPPDAFPPTIPPVTQPTSPPDNDNNNSEPTLSPTNRPPSTDTSDENDVASPVPPPTTDNSTPSPPISTTTTIDYNSTGEDGSNVTNSTDSSSFDDSAGCGLWQRRSLRHTAAYFATTSILVSVFVFY